MYNGTNVSLKTVLWKVMNHPLAAELSYELAAEYAIEGIRLFGVPLSLVNKVSDPIEIVNYKAALPLDIIDLKGVRAMDERDADEDEMVALTYATDSFHANLSCREDEQCNSTLGHELTYVAEAGVIKTSFSDGFVQVSYKALPMDEDGFPLIPNNQKALLAIEFYILERYLFPLYTIGKITDKAYQAIAQKKDWYMASANTNMQLQSYDHVEAIMNGINRVIINTNAHSNFFKHAGKKERFKRY